VCRCSFFSSLLAGSNFAVARCNTDGHWRKPTDTDGHRSRWTLTDTDVLIFLTYWWFSAISMYSVLTNYFVIIAIHRIINLSI
jgi:hypothetical protein